MQFGRQLLQLGKRASSRTYVGGGKMQSKGLFDTVGSFGTVMYAQVLQWWQNLYSKKNATYDPHMRQSELSRKHMASVVVVFPVVGSSSIVCSVGGVVGWRRRLLSTVKAIALAAGLVLR